MTRELVEQFDEINGDLDRCSQLALKQPLPNKQLVLMTVASFTAAGYAILTEDDPNQKSEIYCCQKILCANCIRIKNFYSFSTQNVDICKRIPDYLLRIRGIWAYFLGNTSTRDYPHR